jgi:outer membrane lipoprotein-sorting protein
MKSIALGLCFLLLTSYAVPASDDLDAVLESLATRRHGTVDFVEQKFLSLLKRPVESSGTLVYDAPDRLEKRTLEPRPETLLLRGDVLTVQRATRSRVLDLKSYPQILPFIESVRATLAGDRAALEKQFVLQFSGNLARWTLTLKPVNAELAKSIRQIQIDGSGNDLLRVEIRQADGDRSLMTLRPRAVS